MLRRNHGETDSVPLRLPAQRIEQACSEMIHPADQNGQRDGMLARQIPVIHLPGQFVNPLPHFRRDFGLAVQRRGRLRKPIRRRLPPGLSGMSAAKPSSSRRVSSSGNIRSFRRNAIPLAAVCGNRSSGLLFSIAAFVIIINRTITAMRKERKKGKYGSVQDFRR